MRNEKVNHPDHYKTGNYECIEVMKEIFGEEKVKDFCKMNAFKYLWRSDRKNGDEDLKKAKWYLDTYLLSEDLNQYDPEEEDQDDLEEEDDAKDADTIFSQGFLNDVTGNLASAFRKAIAAVNEMEDPESEVHQRYEVFKELKERNYADEIAFYHAMKYEVKDAS